MGLVRVRRYRRGRSPAFRGAASTLSDLPGRVIAIACYFSLCVPSKANSDSNPRVSILRRAHALGKCDIELSMLSREQGALECLMAAAEDPAAEALNRAARQFSIALRAEGLAAI